MIIECTKNEAFEQLGTHQLVYRDSFCPRDVKEVYASPYRSGYEWLTQYEMILKKVLKPWLGSHRMSLFGTPQSSGVISEVLANAFCHGNKRDPHLKIDVSIFLGEEFVLIGIRDSGNGFDYRYAFERMRSGKRYYNVAGNGLRRMHELKEICFFYIENGSELFLRYRYTESFCRVSSRK